MPKINLEARARKCTQAVAKQTRGVTKGRRSLCMAKRAHGMVTALIMVHFAPGQNINWLRARLAAHGRVKA